MSGPYFVKHGAATIGPLPHFADAMAVARECAPSERAGEVPGVAFVFDSDDCWPIVVERIPPQTLALLRDNLERRGRMRAVAAMRHPANRSRFDN